MIAAGTTTWLVRKTPAWVPTAPTAEPVLSQRCVTVLPAHDIATCPAPDILVIPGGRAHVLTADRRFMAWVTRIAPACELVLTVCTGSFVLAEAGLLKGREVTTHWSVIDELRHRAPGARVSDELRGVLREDRRLLERDPAYVHRLVDRLFLPNVDYRRVCALVLGPFWEQATPAQRNAFGDEFKALTHRAAELTLRAQMQWLNEAACPGLGVYSSPIDRDSEDSIGVFPQHDAIILITVNFEPVAEVEVRPNIWTIDLLYQFQCEQETLSPIVGMMVDGNLQIGLGSQVT